MASRRHFVVTSVAEAVKCFAVSAFVGSVAMHYVLLYGLPLEYAPWAGNLMALVWGILLARLFEFIWITRRSPYLLLGFKVVAPCPPELALVFGCVSAFAVGALLEAKIPVNFLPVFSVLLLYYGVAYLQYYRDAGRLAKT